MGVPGFFAWLIKNYQKKSVITDTINESIDMFYIDTNCLAHPQCFKVLHNLTKITNLEKLEKLMIKRIMDYTDYIIDFTDPKIGTYIAVDGVAPQAKMDQQRKRRYRSKQDNEIRKEIERKHKVNKYSDWSNTVITPGTEFMEKLHQAFKLYINSKKDRMIIYSSYHTPGEGEHKILQDLKKSKYNTIAIYGLDADLIFLSLASQRNNIYLLRESEQLKSITGKNESTLLERSVDDVGEDLSFVAIDGVKDCINYHISNLIGRQQKQKYNNSFEGFETDISEEILPKGQDFTNDFVFICYLLGNDFLPHLPSIDIKTNGLDFLLECYTEIYIDTKTSIIDINQTGEVEINNVFLELLLKSLASNETYYFREILPKHLERCDRRKCPSSDSFEREIWNIENMKGEKEYDPIKLGDGNLRNWKYRYYHHYFKVSNYQDQLISDMCTEYLKGIAWVAKYYFESIASWDWQYPYTHAPFVSDLSLFMSRSKMDLNHVKFILSKPSEPCTQLLAVLPPSCSSMLPIRYRSLVTTIDSPIIDIFPSKIAIDTLYKDMYWKCVPLIPIVDIERVRTITKSIQLNPDEKIRNAQLEPFVNR
jgi:5'-3' exonuclease